MVPEMVNELEVRLYRLTVGVRNFEENENACERRMRQRFILTFSILFFGFALCIFGAVPVPAQEATGPSSKSSAAAGGSDDASPVVGLQLNKLEDVKDGCRVYFVLSNKTPKAFKTLKVDLILFRTDGVIGKRVFADMAPLRAGSKQQVKLFDLSGIKCADVGSLLVNDVLECRNEDGVVKRCYSRLKVSHIGKVSLSK